MPQSWNWTKHGAVTPVKSQGACGSCWAYSVIGNIEGLWVRHHLQLLDFSEQHLIDCDTMSHGCDGGWPYKSITWLSSKI